MPRSRRKPPLPSPDQGEPLLELLAAQPDAPEPPEEPEPEPPSPADGLEATAASLGALPQSDHPPHCCAQCGRPARPAYLPPAADLLCIPCRIARTGTVPEGYAVSGPPGEIP